MHEESTFLENNQTQINVLIITFKDKLVNKWNRKLKKVNKLELIHIEKIHLCRFDQLINAYISF